MSAPDFWDDQAAAQKIFKEISALRQPLETYHNLRRRFEDLEVMVELGAEEEDLSLGQEATGELVALDREVRQFQLEILLSGPYDRNNAILTLHAGAGGTEAMDWVEMLLRMYSRWAEGRGYRVETLDLLPGEEAGVKSVTILISGENAYGFLRPEKGVHRLVRISPFDASGRRHTSFASVEVMPEIEDEAAVEIRPEELKFDTFRSGGAGGQHVNKTESAVRITHLPTGIVVACQSERSQVQNRATALRILRSKLVELKEEERERELASLRGQKTDIAWGNQIRSYIFQPYSLVKDHRTNVEVGNVQGVMDGDLDPFIYGYLENQARVGEKTA